MWRVGTKIPINVYDGNRPVCQCQTETDAALIVLAVNRFIRHAAHMSHLRTLMHDWDSDGSIPPTEAALVLAEQTVNAQPTIVPAARRRAD
jgi:hypothetical protein